MIKNVQRLFFVLFLVALLGPIDFCTADFRTEVLCVDKATHEARNLVREIQYNGETLCCSVPKIPGQCANGGPTPTPPTEQPVPRTPCECSYCCPTASIEHDFKCNGGKICCKERLDPNKCGWNPVIIHSEVGNLPVTNRTK